MNWGDGRRMIPVFTSDSVHVDIQINPPPLYTITHYKRAFTCLPTPMAKFHHMIHSGRHFAQCLVNSRYSRHLCLLDHMNQGNCYRVGTCLASCFTGFLLTWQRSLALQEANWAKKHWGASVLCVHSSALKSPVLASKSLTAARTNCFDNESTKAKEKKKKNMQTTTSF